MIRINTALAFMIVVLSIVSVNQWSILPLGNDISNWILYFLTTILFLKTSNSNELNLFEKTKWYLKWYIVWLIICFFRGIDEAENYWDYKALIANSFGLVVVVAVFTFEDIFLLRDVIRYWLKIAIPLFFLLLFFIESLAYGYYLVPISFIALFFPILPNRWKVKVIVITAFVILIDISARSNVIKFLFPLFFSLLYYFKFFLRSFFLKSFYILLFSLPLIFFILGISGAFNVFRLDTYIKSDYSKNIVVDGSVVKESLTADTRTLLYLEVIASSINNNYVLFGRTPASGNDSVRFGSIVGKYLKTRKYIRYSNEVSILNIFTWTGFVGVVFYFMIFFQSAKLALFESSNTISKILGLYISFRWVFSWVEDFNRFDIMNVMLWVVIALGYSVQFRSMNDSQLREWVKSFFE